MEYMRLKSLITEYKPLVDLQLQSFFADRVDKASKINSDYKKLIETSAKVSLRGGKRLRPILAILGYQITGGDDKKKIITAAISLEIFHNYLLIHDDIMDRDDYRHGGPNVTGVYNKQFSKTMSPDIAHHHATSFAINAGDILSGLCYEALIESGFDADSTIRTISLLCDTTFTVASGQQLDIIASFNKNLSIKKLLSIAKLKTADYSIIMPLQFGAILAGANDKTMLAMQSYGESVGIAFQLNDDVLGMFGEKKTIGKPDISDLREGKQTVLMYYGFKFTTPKDKVVLEKAFGNPSSTSRDLNNVRKILDNSGAKAKVMMMAQEYIEAAKTHVPSISQDAKYQTILNEFADYCIYRKK